MTIYCDPTPMATKPAHQVGVLVTSRREPGIGQP
jgi:hypothetical protein